ncbi:MAG TPA: hypothetical protein VHN77_12170 [Phycisphaerales bacterium]|nr:hypothetical protein [Phycisphaerales bacterium]
MKDVTPVELQPLSERAEWFEWLDKNAQKLRESLSVELPQLTAAEVEREINAKLGPPTPAQRSDYLNRLSDAVTDALVQRMSDAIVVAVPLQTKAGRLNARGVMRLMTNASSQFLSSMARGIPMRGAATVGIGMISQNGALLGPVLQEAYDLERLPPKNLRSKEECGKQPKNWCRLVVSDELYGWLEDFTSSADLFEREAARECLKFIIQDESREWVIDYAGSSVPVTRQLVTLAYKTATTNIELASKSANPDSKLHAEAWQHVAQYLGSKLHVSGSAMGW